MHSRLYRRFRCPPASTVLSHRPSPHSPPIGYVDPSRTQVSTLGQIFNETDRTERLIADTDNAIAGVAQRHPNLTGRTFLIATARSGSVGMIASDTDPADVLPEMV